MANGRHILGGWFLVEASLEELLCPWLSANSRRPRPEIQEENLPQKGKRKFFNPIGIYASMGHSALSATRETCPSQLNGPLINAFSPHGRSRHSPLLLHFQAAAVVMLALSILLATINRWRHVMPSLIYADTWSSSNISCIWKGTKVSCLTPDFVSFQILFLFNFPPLCRINSISTCGLQLGSSRKETPLGYYSSIVSYYLFGYDQGLMPGIFKITFFIVELVVLDKKYSWAKEGVYFCSTGYRQSLLRIRLFLRYYFHSLFWSGYKL